FVACLERGAHFRDLTRPVKRFLCLYNCFFADCVKFRQHAAFLTKARPNMTYYSLSAIKVLIAF
ncbi:hypothetical protein, partial [Idiomarina sp.]